MFGFVMVFVGLLFVSGCMNSDSKNDVKKDQNNNVVVEEEKNFDLKVIEEDEGVSDMNLLEKTKLFAVGGFDGEADAERGTVDGMFKHSVIASLDDPASDKFYEGWLVKTTPALEFFSTGELNKVGEVYILNYESEEDKSSFVDVVVTLETLANGFDNNPEAHVLEGSF